MCLPYQQILNSMQHSMKATEEKNNKSLSSICPFMNNKATRRELEKLTGNFEKIIHLDMDFQLRMGFFIDVIAKENKDTLNKLLFLLIFERSSTYDHLLSEKSRSISSSSSWFTTNLVCKV